ncbi:Beta-glucosidase [Bertholletia excelsa]
MRRDFPADFQFGASTSALQTEGYPNEGGRGPATWDFFLEGKPAVRSYLKYKDDVECLKAFKSNAYRFSIAWPRLLPTGKLSGGINRQGINFYNNLIDELVANEIKPFVTLFHFDLPVALQKEYNGLLSPKFVEDYTAFADLCFKTFGDRVQHWLTMNEPQVFGENGYRLNLSISDDPARYPYIAAHHIILAHASAAKVYRERYQ